MNRHAGLGNARPIRVALGKSTRGAETRRGSPDGAGTGREAGREGLGAGGVVSPAESAVGQRSH